MNQILLEEIRANRAAINETKKEIEQVRSDLQIFKGKALGFISLLSFLINAGMQYFKDK